MLEQNSTPYRDGEEWVKAKYQIPHNQISASIVISRLVKTLEKYSYIKEKTEQFNLSFHTNYFERIGHTNWDKKNDNDEIIIPNPLQMTALAVCKYHHQQYPQIGTDITYRSTFGKENALIETERKIFGQTRSIFVIGYHANEHKTVVQPCIATQPTFLEKFKAEILKFRGYQIRENGERQ